MKITILNGPNINLLGIREPEIYGKTTYDDLVRICQSKCNELGFDCEIFQSNHEGDIIDKIQECYEERMDGIIINAGGYSHTSIAIMDAIKGVGIPTVCVHISDVSAREEFRHTDYVSMASVKTFSGFGIDSYIKAIEFFR